MRFATAGLWLLLILNRISRLCYMEESRSPLSLKALHYYGKAGNYLRWHERESQQNEK